MLSQELNKMKRDKSQRSRENSNLNVLSVIHPAETSQSVHLRSQR